MNPTNQFLVSVVLVLGILWGVAEVSTRYYANCSTIPFINKTMCVAGTK